jgi:hypothetical protein
MLAQECVVASNDLLVGGVGADAPTGGAGADALPDPDAAEAADAILISVRCARAGP